MGTAGRLISKTVEARVQRGPGGRDLGRSRCATRERPGGVRSVTPLRGRSKRSTSAKRWTARCKSHGFLVFPFACWNTCMRSRSLSPPAIPCHCSQGKTKGIVLPPCFLRPFPPSMGSIDNDPRMRSVPVCARTGPAPPAARGRPLRWAVNLWLVFHLAAIIVAPASVGPSSDLVRAAWACSSPTCRSCISTTGIISSPPSRARARSWPSWPSAPTGPSSAAGSPTADPAPPALPPPFHAHRAHERAPPELQEKWYGSYAAHLCQSTARPGSA